MKTIIFKNKFGDEVCRLTIKSIKRERLSILRVFRAYPDAVNVCCGTRYYNAADVYAKF